MMHLKAQDRVILPAWALEQGPARPVWGGPHGYQLGVVEKVVTHDHDKSKHLVLVHWSNGEHAHFPESALRQATNDEVDIALDYKAKVPDDRDVWMLVRTSAGNFALNVIEVDPFKGQPPDKRERAKFVVGATKQTLPSVDNSDYNLIGRLILAPDFTDNVWQSLYAAAKHLFSLWELPTLEAVPLPLPEFDSVRQAAATAPKGPAVLFFHLPHGLKDYADSPVGVVGAT